jgi:hypothetical protein
MHQHQKNIKFFVEKKSDKFFDLFLMDRFVSFVFVLWFSQYARTGGLEAADANRQALQSLQAAKTARKTLEQILPHSVHFLSPR